MLIIEILIAIFIVIYIYEKARAANIMFSVFMPVSRSLLCECDCNTPEQGRSGVPCHRYDRSPLEPRTQQFRLWYPVLYRNSFLESYVYVANLGTRSVCSDLFIIRKSASFWSIRKTIKIFFRELARNIFDNINKIEFFTIKMQ